MAIPNFCQLLIQIFRTLSILLIAASSPAFADVLDDARAAAERRDFNTAYVLVKPLAETENPAAMRILGVLYLEGHGTQKNVKEGIRLITSASDAGDSKAQAALSYLITLRNPELDLTQSDEHAFQLALSSSEKGDPVGKALVGRALAYAIGTPRDLGQAIRYLEETQGKSENLGQAILGELVLLGIGTPKDSHRGKIILESVAKQSNDKELTQSLELILKHENRLQDWLNGSLRIKSSSPGAAGWNSRLLAKLAKLQRWPALAALVIEVDDTSDLQYYYLALAAEGVGRLKEAQDYYKIALNPRLYGRACAGFINNCVGIDVRAESNMRVEKIARDLKEMERLSALRRAEEIERSRQAEIAAVEDARKKELERIESAASSGDGDAQYRLALSLLKDDRSSADVQSGMNWLRKAAENGVHRAQLELGIRLRAGRGAKASEAEGEMWLKRSAALGNAEANDVLQEISMERRRAASEAESLVRKKKEAKRAAELKAAEERAEQEAVRKRENAQKLRTL